MRTGQIEMGRTWVSVITVSGGANADAWGIPQSVVDNLESLVQAAETALETAQNESTRTPVTTARCKAAFEALTAFMRDTKKRFFLVPPLDNPALISLGLHPADHIPTPSGSPTAQVTIETYLVGRHELGVKIIYVTGNPHDAANKGYRIWYSVVRQGETPPGNPDDLRKSFFTKRKKDLIEFDFGASGLTAWFAVQVENEGKKGSWGPLVSALIP